MASRSSRKNRLLARLSAKDFEALRAHLVAVELPLHSTHPVKATG